MEQDLDAARGLCTRTPVLAVLDSLFCYTVAVAVKLHKFIDNIERHKEVKKTREKDSLRNRNSSFFELLGRLQFQE